ncbi:hypothetical protein NCLIV_008520 [Neospora caninum Liverpool]|uniref:COX19 cytochrome c oxidase assembly family protein n=1 Tax=Neospora caninum (strain Liverpool) TaxID=572307 RepID=F0V9F8_NEOCL|nr:hypothetical protein NCLIV_008520 [Neospora caninum Liverpool]CBZ50383.1 hypothetical protein NCLIV_008520 [Neospora caninum Liverpool]CEL64991.1 TPA: COX19 cytochrome c oxidase assembly family protein [Neospora caninum Liverpool]|eukprot:XP_003880417.1 hypothetical protein NCLIV_008520 [Neospora caninum Liverpool]
MSSLAIYQSHGKPRPPAKGSFPIDHLGECTDVKKKYLACLSRRQRLPASRDGEDDSPSEWVSEAVTRKWDHLPCRQLAQEYLQCRMQHNLMAPEDLSSLGFKARTKDRRDPRTDASAGSRATPDPLRQSSPPSSGAPQRPGSSPPLYPGLTLTRSLLQHRQVLHLQAKPSAEPHAGSDAPPAGGSTEDKRHKKEKKPRVRTKEDEGFIAGCGAIRPYSERGFFGRLFSRYSWSSDFFKALYSNVTASLLSPQK